MLYQIKAGDSLWRIAERHYGDGQLWRLIYEHNRSPRIQSITGTRLIRPDLIFVGQKIDLPAPECSVPTEPDIYLEPPPVCEATQSLVSDEILAKYAARPKIRSVPFQYQLSHYKITLPLFPWLITVSLKGQVTLQAKDAIDFISLSNGNINATIKQEAHQAFVQLVNAVQFSYDAKTQKLDLEFSSSIKLDHPLSPTLQLSSGIGSNGLPCVKGSFTLPDLQGRVGHFLFIALGLGLEIEISELPQSYMDRLARNLSQWARSDSGQWVMGLGLMVVATGTVIYIIGNDITGVGIADDIPGLAAAAAMFNQAWLYLSSSIVPMAGMSLRLVPAM